MKIKERKMKKLLYVIPLAVLLCITFGCQNKAEKAEVEKFRTQAKLEEQNKELCRKYTEAWNKGDHMNLKEAYAPNYVYYFPSGNPKPMSGEETIEMIKGIREGYPDCIWTIEEMVAVGDMVITRNIFRGTHTGNYLGIPPTGKTIKLSSIIMVRVINGKRIEEREEYDTLPLMQQLGFELKPKEVKK
jgi:steroid delta-isomerase-like uncharacterized protein